MTPESNCEVLQPATTASSLGAVGALLAATVVAMVVVVRVTVNLVAAGAAIVNLPGVLLMNLGKEFVAFFGESGLMFSTFGLEEQ